MESLLKICPREIKPFASLNDIRSQYSPVYYSSSGYLQIGRFILKIPQKSQNTPILFDICSMICLTCKEMIHPSLPPPPPLRLQYLRNCPGPQICSPCGEGDRGGLPRSFEIERVCRSAWWEVHSLKPLCILWYFYCWTRACSSFQREPVYQNMLAFIFAWKSNIQSSYRRHSPVCMCVFNNILLRWIKRSKGGVGVIRQSSVAQWSSTLDEELGVWARI